jgi:ectoine hydroxylase
VEPIVKPGKFTELDHFIFEPWGYFIIPDVLSTAEVEECLQAARNLHEAEGIDNWKQIGAGFEKEPALEKLIDHSSIMPKVRGLYGTDNMILQSAWCTMQPAKSGPGGWHQDGSSAFDFKLLGHPIPLLQLRVSFILTDQSHIGSGNMEMIPGSHRSRVPLSALVRRDGEACPISHVICAPPGSALVFHNAVWHRNYKHDGEIDRYTMHYVYSPPWMRASDRFSNSPELLERTTPLRRALLGEYERPDQPYAGGYRRPPFEDE